MNTRQSLAGFDFQHYNRTYLTRLATNGDSNGNANPTVNDAARYGVRLVPATVAPGQLYWRVIGIHHLAPAENTGKHNLYAELLDEQGKRVRDATIKLQRGWEGQRPDEAVPAVAFDKGENEPATNIPIERNQHLWVSVADDLPSDKVENLHTKHADEPGPNDEKWNTIGHHSFYVIFQRTRRGATAQTDHHSTDDDSDTPTHTDTDTSDTDTPVVITPPTDTGALDDATYVEGFDALPALATLQPGQPFTQSWRVRNSGTRAWEGYALVTVGGKPLNAASPTPIPTCAPGQAITVTVNFTAPTAPGAYHSVWRILNRRGETFGERLWLVVQVADAAPRGPLTATEREARPVLNPPQPTGRLPDLSQVGSDAGNGGSGVVRDPELYAAWKTHIENGFANNQLMFQQLLNGFMNPYWTTVWMYRILFGLGVASFLVAAWLSAFAGKEGYTLIFGGLSALSLLAYFFNRPLQALEENLQFITWLGLIYNSYWTRLLYLNSQPDVQQGLQDATDDAIRRIKELMNAHAKRANKRTSLPEP